MLAPLVFTLAVLSAPELREEDLTLRVKPSDGQAGSFASAGGSVGYELFRPLEPGLHPLVILLHGAAGLERSQQWLRAEGALLATYGFEGVVLHFFDGGSDHRRTVTDALDHFLRSPRPAGLVGFSLGGAVALDVAGRDPRVNAVVDFFGYLPRDTPVERMPPVLILHGEADTVVPFARAREIQGRLGHTRLRSYPGVGHAFGMKEMTTALPLMLRFLGEFLKPRR